MSILSPSKLETIDYGQQFWQAIFNSNAQKLNDIFNKIAGLWNGSAINGQVVVWDNALSKWKPAAVPYPVPQAAIALTIGAETDTTVNALLSKYFTLTLSKSTNLIFSGFSSGMVLDLIMLQDGVGGKIVTSSGNVIVGTIDTSADMYTWLRVCRVVSTTYLNVVANFTAP